MRLITRRILRLLPALLLVGCGAVSPERAGPTGEEQIRLITLDPGHFHAALIQKHMLPGVASQAHVYAPAGPDLTAHLDRLAQFNNRREEPTSWELEIRTGPHSFERMLADAPGNTVVLSGRNRGKIKRIRAAAEAGFHVLADKPWIIETSDLPLLEAALNTAEKSKVAAYDGMTQRFEITCLLQKELVNDRDVFGDPSEGSNAEPAVRMESLHYLYKLVAGVPNSRPAWFFDIREQGEGLTDVGTHLVDLVHWTLFPEQELDYRREIEIIEADRQPTWLSQAEFQKVTGEPEFPDYLARAVKGGRLEYFCNNSVHYTIRDIHVVLDIKWGFEAAPGSNGTSLAAYRGSRSRVEVRQGVAENYRPEVYVVPVEPAEKASVRQALDRKLLELQDDYPGVALEDLGSEFKITIPDSLRVGHEEHFALLTNRFFEYLRDPRSIPVWEKASMMAKYYVTTSGVELARRGARDVGK